VKYFIYIVTLVSFFIIGSCNQDRTKAYVAERGSDLKEKQKKEALEKANKYLLIQENEEIERFIKRHHWDMRSTGSGLRYQIYDQGKGKKVEKGDYVTLNYRVFLLNGDLIYSSETEGPKTFKVGKGGVESGLEELVLLLHKGDKVRAIFPAHLAYGLKGDMKKIPPKTTIIYDLQLTEIK